MTNDCILACDYCFRGAKEHRNISYETATRAIDWLIERSGDEKGLGVSLFGGEPLMQFELIRKIVPYGKRKAAYHGKTIKFGATTNMVLVDDRMIEFFRMHGMTFHTSIDGGRDSHDKHRHFPDGRGTWDLIESKARNILSIWPDTTARATICNDNVHRWFEDTLALASLGYTNLAMIPVPECEWTEQEWALMAVEARKISEYYIERYRQGNPIYIKHIDDAVSSIVKPERRRNHCGAGRGSVLVKTDGRLYPCHRFGGEAASPEWCLGSIFGELNEKVRKVFLDFDCNAQTKADCENCLAVHLCGICCIAVNWTSFHDIYHPHPNHCRMYDLFFREGLRVHYILQSERNARFMAKYYASGNGGGGQGDGARRGGQDRDGAQHAGDGQGPGDKRGAEAGSQAQMMKVR